MHYSDVKVVAVRNIPPIKTACRGMIRVGVTGGIGSGKSTVCRLFAERGVPVYDSDSEAKRLMREDPSLRAALVEAFGDETFRDAC